MAQRRDVPKAASVRYPVHTGLRISPPKTPYNNWDLTRNQDVKGKYQMNNQMNKKKASNSHKGRHMIDFGLGKLRLWSAAAACAGLFMTQAAGAHPAAFTLNDVMQTPFPYDMVPAPAGSAVAWVFDAKGCRNIWVADPSHGAKARQITPYTECDGFNIGDLAWSPDTKSIAFTRGVIDRKSKT
jgi:hypothetical protein